jgi:hypothetical protein
MLKDDILSILNHPAIEDSEHWTNPETQGMAHVSASNHCARQVYYSIRYPTFRPTLPIICGLLVDEYIKSAVSQIDNLESNVQVDFRPLYPVIGEADLCSPIECLDIKTTSEVSLNYRMREGPSHDHVAQVNLYAYGLEKEKASLLYLSRDKFRHCDFSWDTDRDMAKKSLERLTNIWQTVQAANYIEEKGPASFETKSHTGFVLPAKINGQGLTLQPGISWECRYCPFVSKCKKGEM